MKKTFYVLCIAGAMTSCGMFSGTSTQSTTTTNNTAASTTTTTTQTATEAGKGAGTALLALYKQYKADGKYDYTNLTNAANTLTLVQNCSGLKNSDATYRKEFGQGLMLTATSLVNTSNVETVTNNLTEIATQYTDKAASTANSAAEKLATASQTASSISNLLSLFK